MTTPPENRNHNMLLVNGIILGIIGVLTLLTPLVTSVPGDRLAYDLVAGGALIAVAGYALWRRRHP